MIARLQYAKEAHVSRLTAGESEGFLPLLQDSHSSFQLLSRRVLESRIVVSRRYAKLPVTEGGCLEYRETDSSCDRVAPQAAVDHLRVEFQLLLAIEFIIIVVIYHSSNLHINFRGTVFCRGHIFLHLSTQLYTSSAACVKVGRGRPASRTQGGDLSAHKRNRVGGRRLFRLPTSHTTAHAVPQAAVQPT